MNIERAPIVFGDLVSGAAIVFSWVSVAAGWATPFFALLASLIAMAFYIIQIAESGYVRGWMDRRRLRRIAVLTIELAKLQAEIKVSEVAREVPRQQ